VQAGPEPVEGPSAAPLGLSSGFRLGRPLSFLARLAGEVSSLPVAQPGAQGDAGLRFGRFSPSSARPRPSARALGASEESATARRAAGSTALVGGGGAAGKASVCTTRLCWALVGVRGVSVCSTPPGFQAGVAQAVRPPSPRSALLWVSGWAARFLGSGWGAKCRPFPWPNPALKGTRGYSLAGFPLVWSARAPQLRR